MITINVDIVKDIPKNKIKQYEDRAVYYVAVETREYTKGMNAYPELTGDLKRTEIASPVTGGNAEYNLLAGTKYAKYVWNMTKVKWTNSSTIPQWYSNVYKKHQATILESAKTKAGADVNE